MPGDRGSCGVLPVSDGLRLRLLAVADAPALHALIEANRTHLARWLPWAEGQTRADTEEFIQRSERQLAGNDGFQAAVVRDGRLAGVAGFTGVDWDRRASAIGYWLAEGRQGEGTMTAAVGALVGHAFFAWDLERVEIRVATGNRRSRAIPERLGFREERVLHAAERVGDLDLDLVVYSTLAAEWRRRVSRAVRP